MVTELELKQMVQQILVEMSGKEGGVSKVAPPAAQCVACDEGDGLLIVHRHAGEGLPHIAAGGHRIGYAVGPLRVDVDESHLHGGQGVFKVALAGIALVTEPLGLGSPVDVVLRFPDILPPAGKTEGLQPHRLEGAVAREDHQVGPGDLLPVLLLDRPQ